MLSLPILFFGAAISASSQVLDTSELFIETKTETIPYAVEEALTSEQKKTGLMYRKQMDKNRGMIFYNKKPQAMYMWMKNTFIPLDMIFADKKGEIVCIFEDTTPHSLEILACPKDVALTLELNAGQVAEHKIKLGDKILHHLLKKDENK